MTIAFDGRPVVYAFGELDQIVTATMNDVDPQAWLGQR